MPSNCLLVYVTTEKKCVCVCVCVQELPPPLRDPPRSEEKQQDCISENNDPEMSEICPGFSNLPEACGGGGAKHIYLLCEHREMQKKRFLLTHSP